MLPWAAPLPLSAPVSGPPQWIEPIADDELSNVATYEVTWAGDYEAVLIDYYKIVPVTDNVIAYLRTTSNGGATWDGGSALYNTEAMGVSASNLQRFAQQSGAGSVFVHPGANQMQNYAFGGLTLAVTVLRPFKAEFTQVYGYGGYTSTSGPGSSITRFAGQRTEAARVDGLQIRMDTGNISTGRVRARGIVGQR